MELSGSSAIIAGGAGGFGSATARHLRSAGMGVVLLDPDGDRASAIAAELPERSRVVVGNSSDDDAVDAAITAAQELATFRVALSATGVVIRSPTLIDQHGAPMPREVLQANLDLHVM